MSKFYCFFLFPPPLQTFTDRTYEHRQELVVDDVLVLRHVDPAGLLKQGVPVPSGVGSVVTALPHGWTTSRSHGEASSQQSLVASFITTSAFFSAKHTAVWSQPTTPSGNTDLYSTLTRRLCSRRKMVCITERAVFSFVRSSPAEIEGRRCTTTTM